MIRSGMIPSRHRLLSLSFSLSRLIYSEKVPLKVLWLFHAPPLCFSIRLYHGTVEGAINEFLSDNFFAPPDGIFGGLPLLLIIMTLAVG